MFRQVTFAFSEELPLLLLEDIRRPHTSCAPLSCPSSSELSYSFKLFLVTFFPSHLYVRLLVHCKANTSSSLKLYTRY